MQVGAHVRALQGRPVHGQEPRRGRQQRTPTPLLLQLSTALSPGAGRCPGRKLHILHCGAALADTQWQALQVEQEVPLGQEELGDELLQGREGGTGRFRGNKLCSCEEQSGRG